MEQKQEKLFRVSDILSLTDSERAVEATKVYESLIQAGDVSPHIEAQILELPDSAKRGKNEYRRHWLSMTHSMILLATAYPKAELAALCLGAMIAIKQVETKGVTYL